MFNDLESEESIKQPKRHYLKGNPCSKGRELMLETLITQYKNANH